MSKKNNRFKLYNIKKTLLITGMSVLLGSLLDHSNSVAKDEPAANITLNENYILNLKMELIGKHLYSDNTFFNPLFNNNEENTIIEISEEEAPTVNESNLNEESNKILVALTFDDGPGKYTDRLLDVLNENGAKATFFVLGPNVSNYPDTVARMTLEGHEIGIHGYSHTSFKKLTIDEMLEEIELTNDLIEEAGATPSSIVRPPYGSYNQEILENLDYTVMYWTVDTEDWKTRDKDCIIEEINSSIKEGSVILMHDIHECSVEAIEELLPSLTETYEFVTLDELYERLYEDTDKNAKAYIKVK